MPLIVSSTTARLAPYANQPSRRRNKANAALPATPDDCQRQRGCQPVLAGDFRRRGRVDRKIARTDQRAGHQYRRQHEGESACGRQAQNLRQPRRRRHGERGHRGQDVHATLAGTHRKKQHDEHDPRQQHDDERVALAERRAPARPQPRHQCDQGQPQQRDDIDGVVPERLLVMPRRGITRHCLVKQDLIAVLQQFPARCGHEHHRHEPECDGTE